ncbi:type II toxin-antitoxin system VapC family toxin [Salmonirosea aquatica]|uniref:PIN domain-containing protein n=1 Tax=Salmonirosea aquatica TaxID=2654236 RepID=A0A7C9BBX4_9BACT|nr:PIN domain-containing protein [Cytophagaceae bacterium SJW1-29]
MRYLIDTQIAVWAKENNLKLTPYVKSLLEDSGNEILVSRFSLIELSIKLKIGKLPDFIINLETFIETLVADGFTLLPVSNRHISTYQDIPLFDEHRDPFDRYIIATAHAEGLPLISADSQFERYESFISLIKI